MIFVDDDDDDDIQINERTEALWMRKRDSCQIRPEKESVNENNKVINNNVKKVGELRAG